MISIKKMLLPTDRYSLKCPYEMKPTRVVVHNTANDADAEDEISYMIRNNREVSFHYAVDDKEAVQGIPENRNSWNAGDGNGKGNREGISIEICYSESGGERFRKAEQNAAELIADILRRYGWGIDRVTKHQDYNGKNCPHRSLGLGWERFLEMIEKAMGENPTPPNPPESAAAFYRVRTKRHGWLPEVRDLTDYAGYQESAVTDIAVKVSSGKVQYRVHVKGGAWLPYVTGYSLNDSRNGYAGNGRVIDAVEIIYTPADGSQKRAKYHTAPVGGSRYYAWQYDNERGNGQDGYAGLFGREIGKFQLIIE